MLVLTSLNSYSNKYHTTSILVNGMRTMDSVTSGLAIMKLVIQESHVQIQSNIDRVECGEYFFAINYSCGVEVTGTFIITDCSLPMSEAMQSFASYIYTYYVADNYPGCNQTPFPECSYSYSPIS